MAAYYFRALAYLERYRERNSEREITKQREREKESNIKKERNDKRERNNGWRTCVVGLHDAAKVPCHTHNNIRPEKQHARTNINS